MKTSERLGERIKRRRNELELSQQAVAGELGVSRVAVTKWESGDTANLKLHNLLGLCKLLRMSPEELITGSRPAKKLDQPHLTKDEELLLTAYRSANEDGQTALMTTARAVAPPVFEKRTGKKAA